VWAELESVQLEEDPCSSVFQRSCIFKLSLGLASSAMEPDISKLDDHDQQPLSSSRQIDCLQPERPGRINIMALPSEILAEVLLLAADWHQPKRKLDSNVDIPAYYSSYCRNVVRFSHVCRAWRIMMLDTPQFWIIGPPKGLQGLRTFIERSKTLPLRLHLLYTTTYASIGYLHQVSRHAHRVRALHVCVDISPSEPRTSEWLTWSLENASFPLLEQLDISSRKQPFNIPDPRCTPGWSNLRELSIDNCEFTWPVPKLLKGLRKLSYTVPRYVSDEISSKMIQLFQGLAHSPLLESLELSNPRDHLWETDQDEEATQSYPPVHLPNLRHINLRRFTCRQLIAFTNHIRPSEDVSIKVDIAVTRNPVPSLLLSVFERLIQLVVLHRGTVDDWTINFKNITNVRGHRALPPTHTSGEQQYKCVVHMDVGRTPFWDSPYPAHIQADLLRGLCSPVMTALSLHCIADWTSSHWQQILDVCPQLQTISLDGNVTGLFSFLTALTQRSLDSRSCRYLPRLQHLRLLGIDLCPPTLQHTQDQPDLRTLLIQVLQLRKETNIPIILLWLGCIKECEDDDVAELRHSVGKLKWVLTNPDDNAYDCDSPSFWYA
jgi:hypothetical protein